MRSRGGGAPSSTAALGEAARPQQTLPEIEKLEREVTLATASAYDLHFRLLPHLREIAQARLERSGRSPGPDTLGRWWELLRARPSRARGPVRQGDHAGRTACSGQRPCEDVTVTIDLDEVGRLSNRVLDEVEKAVVGKRDALELLMLGLLADGHVLIEDYPGLAKTLMARSFAQRDVARLLADPVHARPDAVGRDRLVGLQPAGGGLRVPARARSSRTSSLPTRSTAPRRRRRRRCSRRCRNGR